MATGGYYTNPVTGTIQQQTNRILGEGLVAAGWNGPYPTMAAAHAALNASGGSLGQKATGAATSVVSDTLKPLFQKAIWLRVGEVVVGLILLGIGLNSLLKGKPLQVVTSAAGLAGKAAML